MSQATLFVLFHMLVLSTSTQDIHYVRSNGSSLPDHHGQPCLTLEQFIRVKNRYFTAGATFIFLEGNHSLQTPLEISHISNLSLTGVRNDSSVSIMCREYISLFNATSIAIERLTFKRRSSNSALISFNQSDNINISNSVFLGERHSVSAALSSYDSNITITNCLFKGNENLRGKGGAIFAEFLTNLRLTGNNFMRNGAGIGGAIYASKSSLILEGSPMNLFRHNFCNVPLSIHIHYGRGGAIYCTNCVVNIRGKNIFEGNHCLNESIRHDGCGGAIMLHIGKLSISGVAHFYKNKAKTGIIYLKCFHAQIEGESINFLENSGGGIDMTYSPPTINYCSQYCKDDNKYCTFGNDKTLISANFVRNDHPYVIIKIFDVENIILRNMNIIENNSTSIHVMDSSVELEGANLFSGNYRTLLIADSTVVVSGTTRIYNSYSIRVSILYSNISFTGYTLFHNNSGLKGSAIVSNEGSMSFNGITIFTNNTATGDSGGGALNAMRSEITMKGNVTFSFNSAKNGGAMWLDRTSLTLAPHTTLSTSYNTASEYGGVIYNQDRITAYQCAWNLKNELRTAYLPKCLLRIKYEAYHTPVLHIRFKPENSVQLNSYKNTAGKDGIFLYGGLLDRCRYSKNHLYDYLVAEFIFTKAIQKLSRDNEVTSQTYSLCFCDRKSKCDHIKDLLVHRGQKFIVTVVALGQNNSITPTTVTAVTSQNARLKDNYKSQQSIQRHCSDLTYSIYSKESQVNLTLYPDGPCRDTGTAKVVINVTLLPCPDAFVLEGEQCVCEDRLQKYNTKCIIGEKILIRREDSRFWMNVLYINSSYQGLILYRSCPINYCTNEAINITLDNLDIQCNNNRTGTLCGACATNYSLLLGGSLCDVCSHHYLALLLPFALAGIALVVFLSCLRLTVATGFINSFILYANFVQANKIIFFPSNKVSVFTVFIAWLNLDLGFQTCFIPGLDAYTQTWLQFAFPLYVWLLIGLIIFSSRYSITVSKLIGRNPIAVLATLILMSYTKILKIIIETLSSVKLDYPNGEKVSVWLKDANVPYLQSRHLALSAVTSLVLTFLFVPYTILLLTGPYLYRVSHRRCYFFLRRIKPLLDSYYAPYKKNTRYWTGFLLVVRCALYIVFSFNSLGGTNKSLLAIIIIFTAIGFISWYLKRIYRKLYIEVIEGSIYLNLIVLSAATLAGVNEIVLVNTLIGIVFATMLGTIVYQFHLLYISNTATWLKIRAKVSTCLQKLNATTKTETPIINTPTNSAKTVSKTVIELREPLLET